MTSKSKAGKLTKRTKSDKTGKTSKLTKLTKTRKPLTTGDTWRTGTTGGGNLGGRTAAVIGTRIDRTADTDSDDAGPTITTTITTTAPDQGQLQASRPTTEGLTKPTGGGRKAPVSRAGGMRFHKLAPSTANVDLATVRDDDAMLHNLLFAVQDKHQNKIQLVVDGLRSQNTTHLTTDELVAAINRIGDIYDQIADDDAPGIIGNDAAVAVAIRTIKRTRDELSAMIGTDRVETVPEPQLRAMINFLKANPGLRKYLTESNIGFAFDSAHAKSQGGGVFHNGNIHLYGLESENPNIFIKLAIHEAGHGTYQRLLLPGKLSPPPGFWDTGVGPELEAKLDGLRRAAEAEGVDLANSRYAKQAQGFQKQLADARADGLWDSRSEDAKALYRAWVTLRQNDGQHLQGVDLGSGKDPAQRRKYQADNFSEFCAESFMLVATGDIDAHLTSIDTDNTVPRDVKDAWMAAARILDTYAQQRVLGRRSAFG